MVFHTEKFFFSNSLDYLYLFFKETLKLNDDFFLQRVVIVPDQRVKKYLQLRLADDFTVCSNIHFIEKEKILDFFFKLEKTFLNSLENTLFLKNELRKVFPDYSEKKIEYLLRLFSIQFQRLFPYGFIGNFQKDFQKEIWEKYQASYLNLAEELKKKQKPKTENAEVYLFGIDFMPLSYRIFFKNLSLFFPVCHLVFSPCLYFWEDLLSDYEKAGLKKHLKLKNFEKLEEYLPDRNNLLANWGKLGREHLKLLDAENGFEEYEDPGEKTLLQKIKKDLLFLEKEMRYEIDDSIQIHEADSRLQEVFLVKNAIYEKLNEGYKPSDFAVYAPDIKEYESYLRLIFERDRYPFKIYDLNCMESVFVKGFFLLFSFFERWDKSFFLSLLENPSFQKKHFSESDVLILKKWLNDSSLYWGLDENHKKKILNLPFESS